MAALDVTTWSAHRSFSTWLPAVLHPTTGEHKGWGKSQDKEIYNFWFTMVDFLSNLVANNRNPLISLESANCDLWGCNKQSIEAGGCWYNL